MKYRSDYRLRDLLEWFPESCVAGRWYPGTGASDGSVCGLATRDGSGVQDGRQGMDVSAATAFTHDVLIVPGLHNSGSTHWQTLWERSNLGFRRVEQPAWASRDVDQWASAVDRSIESCTRPVLIVAHSFGCLAAIRRVMVDASDVAGMLLVAPADPRRFCVMPAARLSMPAMVVVGANDPCTPFDIAQSWAARLGSRFVNIGEAGHINPASGFGPWPYGWHLLNKLEVMAAARWYPMSCTGPARQDAPEAPQGRESAPRTERGAQPSGALACLGFD
jgi:uncharacterized protein